MTLSSWQAASVAFDEWACNGTSGRAKTDPVYQLIVEGRDVPATYAGYSSCGDRAHAKFWRFGCRLPFVNREERNPGHPHDWHVGANIIYLHDILKGAPCMQKKDANGHPYAVRPDADWVPEPGDELLIWNDPNHAHCLSITAYDSVSHKARTANYGAGGMSKSAFPGAKIGVASLVYSAHDGWLYGDSHTTRVQRVTKLAALVATLTEKPNFDGIPWSDTWTGECADELIASVVS